MGAFVKVIVGAILILIGLGLFLESPGIRESVGLPNVPFIGKINWFGNFVTVLTGFIPPFLLLIGVFVVWLELDELKIQKELNTETKPEKKKEEAKIKEKAKE